MTAVILRFPYSVHTESDLIHLWHTFGFHQSVSPSPEERNTNKKPHFIVFIIPRWKMGQEMTNPLIWSDFVVFFFPILESVFTEILEA